MKNEEITGRPEPAPSPSGWAARARRLEAAAGVFRPGMVLAFCLWTGLVTANLELMIFWLRWRFIDPAALSSLQLNQHAMWMVPLSQAIIFSLGGIALSLAVWVTRSRWVVAIAVIGPCFLSAYALSLTYRGLSSLACVALSGGLAYRIGSACLIRASLLARVVRFSLPALIGLTAVHWAIEPAAERCRQVGLAPARPGAPNLLFIVLDTVRAESLSLHGYERPTSPFLASLAARGVRFEQARSAAPWTLPSHATMFTGRWPHELSTRLDRPLDSTFPTLAEHLRDQGYATAGFVANTFFCSRWFGLSRGFLHYDDVAINLKEILRSTGLGRAMFRKVSGPSNDRPTAYFERKDAATINAELLGWLDSRPAGRPFFAFLNYYDAHDPYLPPDSEAGRPGESGAGDRRLEILRDWHRRSRGKVPDEEARVARDSYEGCIQYLDRQLGRLFAQLESRGELANTVVILTSDHGEEFGEHGFFGHGQQLYSQVLHVPLLIVGADRAPAGRSVPVPVSLRDLPATVVDLLGTGGSSSFPGRSLARYWNATAGSTATWEEPVMSEIDDDDGRQREGPPARAVVDRGMVYIHEADQPEEVYDLVNDPHETRNLASQLAGRGVVARLRRLAESYSPPLVAGTSETDGPIRR